MSSNKTKVLVVKPFRISENDKYMYVCSNKCRCVIVIFFIYIYVNSYVLCTYLCIYVITSFVRKREKWIMKISCIKKIVSCNRNNKLHLKCLARVIFRIIIFTFYFSYVFYNFLFRFGFLFLFSKKKIYTVGIRECLKMLFVCLAKCFHGCH